MTQRLYIGSCADDKIGIGTIIAGSDYRYHQNECFEILDQSGNWIECYDIVRVLPNGDIEWINIDPQ